MEGVLNTTTSLQGSQVRLALNVSTQRVREEAGEGVLTGWNATRPAKPFCALTTVPRLLKRTPFETSLCTETEASLRGGRSRIAEQD